MTDSRLYPRKTRALALALSLAMAFVLLFAAAAEALPAKFWGVVPQSTPSAEQVRRLSDGGVESIRVPFSWGDLQPQQGGPIDWSGVDTIVEGAARGGVDVLPTLTGAPAWAVPVATVPGGGGAKAPPRLPAAGVAAAGWKNLIKARSNATGPAATSGRPTPRSRSARSAPGRSGTSRTSSSSSPNRTRPNTGSW